MSYQPYRIREDTVFDEQNQSRLTFGINFMDPNGEEVLTFPDLFRNRKEAEDFVSLCNKGELSAAHLPEVLDDYLGNGSF